jgi:hypothetical protein
MEKNTEEIEEIKNASSFILDPLSVIVKLAIISHKKVGTKINISNNMIQIQEVGIFQSLVRFVQSNKKLDLQYLYNPIEFACEYFLTEEVLEEIPNMSSLFTAAIKGIEKLTETYKDHALIVLCLHYYTNLISNYLGDYYNDELFKVDSMTPLYKKELLEKFTARWTNDRILLILEFNEFLKNNEVTNENVNCLEIFMKNVDEETRQIVTDSS